MSVSIDNFSVLDHGGKITSCRLCGYGRMTRFLDLGFTPPADRFLTPDQLDTPEVHYPLRVVRCDQCNLVQLDYVVSPVILYQEDYPYESSMTKTGRTHFDSFAQSVIETFDVKPDELAVDIGSNVGVLLQGFKTRGCRVLGIDPAQNIAEIAIKNGIPTVADFFSEGAAVRAREEHGRARVITATNVFAHVDDLIALMKGVDELLSEDGIFIVEAPYLKHLLDSLEYDTIYHEHLSYLSLSCLVPFVRNRNFELFDVEQMDIHGGSIRIFIGRPGRKQSDRLQKLLREEEETGIHSMEYLNEFSRRVRDNRRKLNDMLRSLKAEGKRIAAVSAPAKGMTLLNYCKLDGEVLDFVTEKSLLKVGKFAPGTHLPIVPDETLLEENIDYALLLAWNFKTEIMNNLSAFRERGGKFIIPIPTPEII